MQRMQEWVKDNETLFTKQNLPKEEKFPLFVHFNLVGDDIAY